VRVEFWLSSGAPVFPSLHMFSAYYVNDMARATGELGFVLFAVDMNLFAEGQDPAALFERVNGGVVCVWQVV
jgi:hypothetical protein